MTNQTPAEIHGREKERKEGKGKGERRVGRNLCAGGGRERASMTLTADSFRAENRREKKEGGKGKEGREKGKKTEERHNTTGGEGEEIGSFSLLFGVHSKESASN